MWLAVGFTVTAFALATLVAAVVYCVILAGIRADGGEAEETGVLRDLFYRSATDAGGLVPSRARAFMRRHADAFNALPGLRDEVEQAIAAVEAREWHGGAWPAGQADPAPVDPLLMQDDPDVLTPILSPTWACAGGMQPDDARLLVLQGEVTVECGGQSRTCGQGEVLNLIHGRPQPQQLGFSPSAAMRQGQVADSLGAVRLFLGRRRAGIA